MYRDVAPRDADNQPYIAFLDAYPHPAFVLPASSALTKGTPSLVPVYANVALRRFVLGTKHAAEDVQGSALLTSFIASQDLHAFGLWLISADPSTDLELRPKWYPGEAPNASITVTKTTLGAYTVCTTVLRTPLPKPVHASPSGRRRSPGLVMPNFPERNGSPRADCQLFSPGGNTSVATLLRTYDWASTPLGPREGWPQSLVSAVGLCMSAAYPVCCAVVVRAPH